MINAALNFWQSHTCLKFERAEELGDGADMIHFFSGPGCYSNVGRKGGNQPLSVADGCEDASEL